jgi:hypothetical protein
MKICICPEDCISEDEEYASTPLQLVQHGNSDPFSSFPLQLDPFVNELINFEERHLWPALSDAGIERLGGRRITDWVDARSPAENQIRMFAYLSRAASLLSTVTPDAKFARMALVYKGRSIKLLQDQIASPVEKNVAEVAENVIALQKAELFARNRAGTLVHTKFLAALLQHQRKCSRMDTNLFFSAVHTDLQCSAMYLTRPHFDISPNSWVMEEYRKLGLGRTTSTGLAKLDAELDLSIHPSPLRSIFLEVRALTATASALSTSPSPSPKPTLQVPAGVLLCTGRFINFYLSHCTSSEELKQNLRPDEYAQVCACLAGLHWTRTGAKFDSMPVGSSTFYTAGPLILKRLREAWTLMSASTTTNDNDDEDEADDSETNDEASDKVDDFSSNHPSTASRLHFWILAVGACSEQHAEQHAESTYFTTRLASLATSMSIFTWQQAREILCRFLYTDVLEPHGSTWFWKIFDRPLEDG